ncbi:hypothetical protein Ancab_006208 [Ancistrocladus abbreviatus]
MALVEKWKLMLFIEQGIQTGVIRFPNFPKRKSEWGWHSTNTLDDKASSELLLSKSDTDEEGIEEIEAAKTEGSNYAQELLDTQGTSKRTMRCKRPVKDNEEVRKFNPREPNYLPVEPETEGERVDLRHQEIDKRKNAEEWMLDYALQQAVSKLAPARKSKVALLVVAFETVMPISKCETHLRQNIAGSAHARPMQACS